MSLIVNNLYLAGIKEVIEEVESKKIGITHILNVAEELRYDRSEDYTYLHLGVVDDDPNGDITNLIETCVDWIFEAIRDGGVVMIHCFSGVSRSTCIVIAYLVKYHDLSVIDAYHKVLAHRPIIDPWPTYLTQIENWSKNYCS